MTNQKYNLISLAHHLVTINLLIFFLFTSEQAVSSSFSCMRAFQASPTIFETQKILRDHGIDPQAVTFKRHVNESYPLSIEFTMLVNDREVGWLQAVGDRNEIESDDHVILYGSVMVQDVVIDEIERGKGLGTLLYLVTASYFRLAHNLSLVSTGPYLSEEARIVWQRLTDQNVATIISARERASGEDYLPQHLVVNENLSIFASEVERVYVKPLIIKISN